MAMFSPRFLAELGCMDTPNNPHDQDRLFRLVFGRQSAASAFLKSVLPEQTNEALDWSALFGSSATWCGSGSGTGP